jgi:predicted RNase H-like HicB family nuclease
LGERLNRTQEVVSSILISSTTLRRSLTPRYSDSACRATSEKRPQTKSERRRIHRMKFVVTVDRDEDGVFVAECPAIPGCVSQGVTEGDALKNIEDAIRECLEVRAEKGMPLTVAVHQVDVSV